MASIDLEAIEKRASAATAGPWETGIEKIYHPRSGVPRSNPVDTIGDIYRDEDRAFIAAAREDVPALVAEVKRLRAEVKALRAPRCAYPCGCTMVVSDEGETTCGMCRRMNDHASPEDD